jgi:acyl-[acyl-carrier-protein]-phospholipid O-acyltransferase/long-chain-fatty-acid--[acyl-carrier-protein] ligase
LVVNPADRSFNVVWPLLVSQTIGAFNDNAMKAMLPVMAAVQFGKPFMDTVNQQVSILLILPFVLFAPLAGWIADRFSKKTVITWALFGQLIGLGVLGCALYSESLEFSLAGFFILSTQSAFFSPVKKGILKELVGGQRLGKAVGFMEMLAMVGILGGAFVGALSFDQMVESHGGWNAAFLVCAFISFLALCSWIISWLIPETEVVGTKPFRFRLITSHFQDLLYLYKKPALRYAALGDAWFWAVGGFFYLVLVKLSGEVLPGQVGMGTLYGYWFLLLGVGIMIGSLFVAYLNHGRVEIGLSAIGAVGMPFVFLSFCLIDPLSLGFDMLCFVLGFFGALFFVPLNGYLQNNAMGHDRGRILAASNLLTQLLGILLIALHAYLSNILELSVAQELLVIFVPAVLVAFFTIRHLLEDFFRAWFHMLLRIFYRIRVEGMEHFPKNGGCILVSNHLSYADPVFIGAAFPRKVRYLAYSGLAQSRLMRFVFRITETLTVSPEKSLSSIRKTVQRLRDGTPLCIFAEGGISRIGMILPFMRGPFLLATKAGVPVLPVHLDGVWGSVFSMEKGRFFTKIPLTFPYRVTVRVGPPLLKEEVDQTRCRQAVMELGRKSFAERVETKLKVNNFFESQIFRHKDGVFWESDGAQVTHSEFKEMVKGEDRNIPKHLFPWVKEVRQVISVQSTAVETQVANWLKVKESHFWDFQNIKINAGPEVWTRQWLPWAGVLWGRTISRIGDNYILTSQSATFPEPGIFLTGLATKKNGLISINALSQGPSPLDQSEANQLLGKENTQGRLLLGLTYKVHGGDIYISGINGEDKITRSIVDEDGFLISP